MKNQSNNTGTAILLVILIFGCIIAFFATHEGNSPEDMEFHRLIDML